MGITEYRARQFRDHYDGNAPIVSDADAVKSILLKKGEALKKEEIIDAVKIQLAVDTEAAEVIVSNGLTYLAKHNAVRNVAYGYWEIVK